MFSSTIQILDQLILKTITNWIAWNVFESDQNIEIKIESSESMYFCFLVASPGCFI